ncbi:MAG: sulfite exporter TauE/SafE family protein [Cellvibrionaceae bacterium]
MFDSLALSADFAASMAPYMAAMLIGFLGGGHCIGMCGGVMAALSFAIPPEQRTRRWRVLLSYNAGRILSYTLIGVLAGAIGFQLSSGHGLSILRLIAGFLLIAMGLYLANWWRGLTYLETLGGFLWRRIQPFGKPLMPVKSSGSALLLGMLWGWLPCGLVYTAVAYAIAQGQVIESAGVMLAFGIGTLPAVLASGVFAERVKQLMQLQRFRLVMALCILCFGLWTIWGTYQHVAHGQDHSQHQGHSMMASPLDESAHSIGDSIDKTPDKSAGKSADESFDRSADSEDSVPENATSAEQHDPHKHHH